MKIFRLTTLILFLFTALNSHSEDKKETREMRTWFTNETCESFEILKHKSISKHKIVKQIHIKDKVLTKSIMDGIKALPADGDMMVSFGPDAPHTDLVFYCGEKKEVIEIYSRGFKTPSTGFLTDNESENKLIQQLESLLEPKYSNSIYKAQDTEVTFNDFSIKFLGITPSKPAPVTASWTVDKFEIKNLKTMAVQIVEIIAGQNPPPDTEFKIGRRKFMLLTFNLNNDRLYPTHFAVKKK
jgi:hypothetical protein